MSFKTEPDPPSTGPGHAAPAAGATLPCQALIHARLRLKSVTFSNGFDVDNDTFGPFPAPHWLSGRTANRARSVQQPAQFPYCIVRGSKLAATAVFEVSQRPTVTDAVEIEAEAVVGGVTLHWRTTLTVAPGDSEKTTPRLESDVALPNNILKVDPLRLDWFQTPPDVPRLAAGSSESTLYITLAAPVATPPYWTLLDVSCRSAAGETTVAKLREKSYTEVRSRALNRMRDGHDLTYWNPVLGVGQRLDKMLLKDDGSGSCIAWSQFLAAMWRIHGDMAGIVNEVKPLLHDVFLVKNWRFNPPHPTDEHTLHYTVGATCFNAPGVPGQRNPDPPPAFKNHFIVVADGIHYDPSYGSPTFGDALSWENASIDGLGAGVRAGFRKTEMLGESLLQLTPVPGL